MENNINNKKRGKFITGRRIFLLIPLIVLIFVIANHYSCVTSKGTLCLCNGLSQESRASIYSLIFYFYIFLSLFYISYLIAYIFTKNHSNRIFVAVVATFLLPFIVVSAAVIRDIYAPPVEWGIGTVFVVYIAVIAPGFLLEDFLSKNFSNPDIKQLSVKQLTAPFMRNYVEFLWEEARYQGDSLIVPVLISGKYLRAVRINPGATNASDQIVSLFTVGPPSFTPKNLNNLHKLENDRYKLEVDYERELLNRGILSKDEWNVSEWNPLVWNTIIQQGNLTKAFRLKKDNMPTVLLANIREKVGERSSDLWLFDQNSLEKPINLTLTAFNDSLERNLFKGTVSSNLDWIYVRGDIKSPQTKSYDPLFARINLNGNRDNSFDQEWNTFLESSGFTKTIVTAVEELRNGCLIVAFLPKREKSYQAMWLWLAQRCGDNSFELIGNGELQVPFELYHSSGGINASKIYDINDDNLLIVLNGRTVVKFNLKHKKFDNDFQNNLIHTLQLIPLKENEELHEGYYRKVTSFVMLTPNKQLIFENHRKTLKIIVTDINGIKLFETDDF